MPDEQEESQTPHPSKKATVRHPRLRVPPIPIKVSSWVMYSRSAALRQEGQAGPATRRYIMQPTFLYQLASEFPVRFDRGEPRSYGEKTIRRDTSRRLHAR
jgi:hypothetical protein